MIHITHPWFQDFINVQTFSNNSRVQLALNDFKVETQPRPPLNGLPLSELLQYLSLYNVSQEIIVKVMTSYIIR